MTTTSNLTRDQREQITKERIQERSMRLYEDGYRAAGIPESGCFLMITPGGDPYYVDPIAQSCTCKWFPSHGYCKHSLGLVPLLQSQMRARNTRRELRQQVGSAPTAADPGPAQQQPARRTPSKAEIQRNINRDF